MLSLVEARNYRCLRYIRRPLDRFHVLVGPNASGKTTFLDVVAFLGDLVSEDLDYALDERTSKFSDLLWAHQGNSFELAVEVQIPEEQREKLGDSKYDRMRYEVSIQMDIAANEVSIVAERGWLMIGDAQTTPQRTLFPDLPEVPESILVSKNRANTKMAFSKNPTGNDNYYAHGHKTGGRWSPSFKLGTRKSTLGNLPEDEENHPVSTWFKQFIGGGVESIVLNSLKIRRASAPGQGTGFRPDGSNLPWVVESLLEESPERVSDSTNHLHTAPPDLTSVRTVLRDDDRHRYLMLRYQDALDVPSWMASDGTLRLMALTLPAYLNELKGAYLIEEPENGIHPKAIETMYDSLSHVYDSQVLMATHSPVILGIAEPRQVLCFAKTDEGATDIVRGDQHPDLQDWRGEVDLGTLYASGVLG